MDLNRPQRLQLLKFSAYGFLKNLQFFEPFILLFFTVSKGLSYTEFGALIAVREISVLILEIPTGIIADVTGRRRAMMIAFSAYLISFWLFTVAPSFWIFAVAMVLFGAGEAFRSGTHKSMIMEHLDLEGLSDQKVHYYGRTRGASRLGSAAVALIAAAIVYWSGTYRFIFVASMVPYALGLLLMTTYPKELDGEVKQRASLRDLWQHTADSLRSLFRTRQLARVIANASVEDAFFKVAKDYLQPILSTIAVALPATIIVATSKEKDSALVIGPIYFAIHMNSFVSSRMSGRLVDRVRHLGKAMNMLFWALAVLFCLTGVFLVASGQVGTGFVHYAGLGLAVVAMFFFYTIYNLRKPMVVAFLSDRTEKQQRATILSCHSQCRALIAAVIAPLLGVIADNGIKWDADLCFSPFVFLLGGEALLIAGLLLRLRDRPPEEEGQQADETGQAQRTQEG